MSIFTKEEQVILQAERVLSNHHFKAIEDEESYRSLLEEYQTLLKQMMRMVKMSDMMQLELKNLSYKLEVASQTDVLTGLYNRRFFNETYLRELKNAFRNKSSIASLMIDIDYFKKYNDHYGHLQGDECLAAVAGEIRRVIKRPLDMVARFGGEEFVVLLPETGIEGAACVGEKLLASIRALAMEHVDSPVYQVVTVSIGAAELVPEDGFTMNTLLNMTDSALYTAKTEGRNCLRIYREGECHA